jgi:hypothetical protein
MAGSRVAAALALGAHDGAYLKIGRVVFDERFADARAFAAEARSLSATTSAINGPVHDLWYSDLCHRWGEGKYPVAGMTDHRALFLLEMMAADAGMRVVHRVHHVETGGTHVPRVFGPLERSEERRVRLSSADAGWARSAAGIVMSWPKSPAPIDAGRSDISKARGEAVDARTLVSWIIS